MRPNALPYAVPVGETADRNHRHSKIKRIRDAGGHHVGGTVEGIVCRIKRVVSAFEVLEVVGVPEAGFIHPGGIRSPGPASQRGLRPRVLQILPFLPDDGCRIAHREAIPLAEEIHALQ